MRHNKKWNILDIKFKDGILFWSLSAIARAREKKNTSVDTLLANIVGDLILHFYFQFLQVHRFCGLGKPVDFMRRGAFGTHPPLFHRG